MGQSERDGPERGPGEHSGGEGVREGPSLAKRLRGVLGRAQHRADWPEEDPKSQDRERDTEKELRELEARYGHDRGGGLER